MKIEAVLKDLCKDSGEIEIVEVKNNFVVILVPYENSSVIIDIDGETEEELVESFKESVNQHLENMINHLNDCKL